MDINKDLYPLIIGSVIGQLGSWFPLTFIVMVLAICVVF